jgi:hypothetical protein
LGGALFESFKKRRKNADPWYPSNGSIVIVMRVLENYPRFHRIIVPIAVKPIW